MLRTRRCPGSGCPTIESSPTDSSPSPLTRWQVQKIVDFHSFDPFFSALTWSTLQRAQSGPCEYTRWVKLQAWRETFVYSYYLAKNCGQGLLLYTNFTWGKKKRCSCISGWGGGPGRISMPGCHQLRWVAASALDIDEVESNFNKHWNDVNLALCTWYVGSNHWPWNLEFQSGREVDRRR